MFTILSYLYYNLFKRDILNIFKEFNNILNSSEEQIQEYQFNKMKNIVIYAYENTKFYYDLYNDLKINVYDINSLEDFNKLPIISKTQLKGAISNKDFNIEKFKKIHWAETTGSTGIPFRIPLNEKSSHARIANSLLAQKIAGRKFNKKVTNFWRLSKKNNSLLARLKRKIAGESFIPVYESDNVNETLIIDNEKLRRFLKSIQKEKPWILNGYVSILSKLSEYIIENEIEVNGINIITPGGEELSPYSYNLIKKAFNAKIANRYGGSDFGIVGQAEPEKKYLEILEHIIYMEVINASGNSVLGELGEIIVTDFYNEAIPLIRYKTGDIGRILKPTSASKYKYKKLTNLKGRINDIFLFPTGESFTSHYFHIIFRDMQEIEQFAVVQNKDYSIDIKINYKLNSNVDIINETILERLAYLREKLKVTIVKDDSLKFEKGKFRLSRSEIETNRNLLQNLVILPKKSVITSIPYKPSLNGYAWYLANQNKKDLVSKSDWNEGPKSPPEKIKNYLLDYFNIVPLNWYPDVNKESLRVELSKYLDVPDPNEFLIFNGSDSSILNILLTFVDSGDRVLIFGPTYDQFRSNCKYLGAETEIVYPQDFHSKIKYKNYFDTHIEPPKLIYIVNPNNPTGFFYDRNEIIEIIKFFSDSLIIIDEAYIEFLDKMKDNSSVGLDYPNLIVSRTFSKFFCMAGLRLGYIWSKKHNINAIKKFSNPKENNVFSLKAGELALINIKEYDSFKEELKQIRNEIKLFLSERKFSFIIQEGNFFLLETKNPQGLLENFKKLNIIVRDLSKIKMMENYIRITFPNRKWLSAMLNAIDLNKEFLICEK